MIDLTLLGLLLLPVVAFGGRVPSPPPPSPPPPSKSDREIQEEEARAGLAIRRRRGRSSQILAGERRLLTPTAGGAGPQGAETLGA